MSSLCACQRMLPEFPREYNQNQEIMGREAPNPHIRPEQQPFPGEPFLRERREKEEREKRELLMELLSYSIGSAHEQIARSRRLVAQSEEIIARVKRSLHHSMH